MKTHLRKNSLLAAAFVSAAVCSLSGCRCVRSCDVESVEVKREQTAVFTSNDEALQNAYEWARSAAIGYVHEGEDSVGAWYEAAIPQREGFCIRNVAHQSTAAQILGLGTHTRNMISVFAGSVSEERDWCSFWEVNGSGQPNPANYIDDSSFLYALPANHDLLQACMKMYLWTGDSTYLTSETLGHFYEVTAGKFTERWDLTPEKAMNRSERECSEENHFEIWRGFPSYCEENSSISVGVDLISALYAGNKAFSEFCALKGKDTESARAGKDAETFARILDREWWNPSTKSFNTVKGKDGVEPGEEGIPYILWFGATDNPEKIRNSIRQMKSTQWNEENLSHFPVIYFEHGYNEYGYESLMHLPATSRSDLPEIAFGFVEGCVCGAMGLNPDFRRLTLSTECRIPNPETVAKIENVPVFGGHISLEHVGHRESRITNSTGYSLKWLASFAGDCRNVESEGKVLGVHKTTDLLGNVHTIAEIELKPHSSATARALSGPHAAVMAKALID